MHSFIFLSLYHHSAWATLPAQQDQTNHFWRAHNACKAWWLRRTTGHCQNQLWAAQIPITLCAEVESKKLNSHRYQGCICTGNQVLLQVLSTKPVIFHRSKHGFRVAIRLALPLKACSTSKFLGKHPKLNRVFTFGCFWSTIGFGKGG